MQQYVLNKRNKTRMPGPAIYPVGMKLKLFITQLHLLHVHIPYVRYVLLQTQFLMILKY